MLKRGFKRKLRRRKSGAGRIMAHGSFKSSHHGIQAIKDFMVAARACDSKKLQKIIEATEAVRRLTRVQIM